MPQHLKKNLTKTKLLKCSKDGFMSCASNFFKVPL